MDSIQTKQLKPQCFPHCFFTVYVLDEIFSGGASFISSHNRMKCYLQLPVMIELHCCEARSCSWPGHLVSWLFTHSIVMFLIKNPVTSSIVIGAKLSPNLSSLTQQCKQPQLKAELILVYFFRFDHHLLTFRLIHFGRHFSKHKYYPCQTHFYCHHSCSGRKDHYCQEKPFGN